MHATAGEFTTNSPSFAGNGTTPTGAALVAFESPAIATVNGDLSVTGARTAHAGGRATVSGDFTITAGNSVFTAVPNYVDFLDHVDDGDFGEDPLVVANANIRAANITASVTDGNLALGSAQLITNGTMALNAGGGVNISDRTQSAAAFDISAGAGVNLSNTTLNATGGVGVTALTALNATGAHIRGSDIGLAGRTVSVGGATMEASRAIEVLSNRRLNATAATMDAETIRLEAGTDLSVSNIDLTADAIALVAGGNISNSSPPGTIKAGALAILAGGNVNLANTTLLVGDGSIDSVQGDTLFLGLLAAEGIATPAAGPNLVIRAQNIALGGGALAGDYVYLETNSVTVNGTFTTSNPDLLLQVAPLLPGNAFTFEQSSSAGGAASFVYDNSLAAFNAATIALGSTAHTGNAAMSTNTAGVDIDDTNLFVLTRGTVNGLNLVTSTGVVKDLRMLLRGGFEIPQTGEIDTGQDLVHTLNDDYALEGGGRGDEEEEGDEEGEDTDTDTDVEEDDDSLIRQDTVDEEMMCR